MQRGSLTDLTAFVAVADNLSFRAAASQLGVTPSALSHSMRQLEDRLGIRLLHRTTRSVSLTDAGSRLVERLRPAIDQIGDAFCTGQVELAVHEGAAGEFARLGMAEAGQAPKRGADRLGHRAAAMAVQFSRILAGEAGGAGKPQHQRLVDGDAGQRVA